MSSARRDAKWRRRSRCWAPQRKPPLQRATTSPSGLTMGEPQSGQAIGICTRYASGGRFDSTTLVTCGITSPARRISTVSLTQRPRRAISSMLCNVALDTVTPPTNTGRSLATGVTAPVRPTWKSTSSTTVLASSDGYL